MKNKLSKKKVLFEYSCNNKILFTKICLISTENIDSFFQNRNLLIIDKKKEINVYYNKVFIVNFVNQEDLCCIILQYNKEEDDKLILHHVNTKESSKKKKIKQSDYKAVYKVEDLDFISKEPEKIDAYSGFNKKLI